MISANDPFLGWDLGPASVLTGRLGSDFDSSGLLALPAEEKLLPFRRDAEAWFWDSALEDFAEDGVAKVGLSPEVRVWVSAGRGADR